MFKGLTKQKQVSSEKSSLVPHGQTSKGSLASEDAAAVVFFRAAGSKRPRGEGTGGSAMAKQLSHPRDITVALREVRG